MPPLRDTLGHFLGAAPADEPPGTDPAVVLEPDPLAEAEAAASAAWAALEQHRGSRSTRLWELAALQQAREEAIAGDDPDQAVELAPQIARAEYAIDGLNRHDRELAVALNVAQRRVLAIRAAAMQPRLDEVHEALGRAAEDLVRAVEDARAVESEAIKLGVLQQWQTLPVTMVNIWLLQKWARRGAPDPEVVASAAWKESQLRRDEEARWGGLVAALERREANRAAQRRTA